jgi:hypothetical protein
MQKNCKIVQKLSRYIYSERQREQNSKDIFPHEMFKVCNNLHVKEKKFTIYIMRIYAVLRNNKNFSKVELWLAVIWQSSTQTQDLKIVKGCKWSQENCGRGKELANKPYNWQHAWLTSNDQPVGF